MVKKVPYAEMRFFSCTHVRLYDLPTRRPSGVGRLVGNKKEGLEGYSRDPGFDQNTVQESGKR